MDKDLLFLAECRNDDLQTLADYLVYDPKDKKKRFNESLSKTRSYHIYYPHAMQKIVIEISNELSYYGSNDIAYFDQIFRHPARKTLVEPAMEKYYRGLNNKLGFKIL